jgi:predicted DNA-binding transcriptional regulator YafY
VTDEPTIVLALLGLLQSRIDWSAESLGERLGVTTRTVRRDVSRLRAYGYPVEAMAGHGGGYRFGPGGSLPPLLLDDHETLVVALGLRIASQAAISGLEDASVSALAKIEQLLPARPRPKLEQLDSIVFTEQRAGSVVDRGVFSALTRAATVRVTVRFGYVDQHDATSERNAEPVRLVRSRNHWYLVAYDLERGAWRTLRVDRVRDVEVTQRRFIERAGPDPIRLVRRTIPVENFAHRAVIELHATGDEARKRIPSTIAEIISVGTDRCCLIIGTDDLPWLARYLLVLPWYFEAVEPPALRHELRTLGKALAQRHTRRQSSLNSG